MSVVKKQNECIKRDKNQAHNLTSRVSEWFRIELEGVQKARNLKSGLRKHNLNVLIFLFKNKKMGLGHMSTKSFPDSLEIWRVGRGR